MKPMKKNKSGDCVPITAELIRELRAKRQYAEADALVKAFRAHCDKEKTRERNRLAYRARKIKIFKGAL